VLLAFIALSCCCIALAIGLGLRHEIQLARDGELDWHAPFTLFPGSPWSLMALIAGCLWTAGFLALLFSSAPWAAGCSLIAALALCLLMARAGHQGKSLFQSQELQEMAWIVRQRGSVQDQIMRACEREAMERRLRRCQATLMLTRRGGNDLSQLFSKLEEQVALMEHDAMEAADVVGGFAAHLRHVFMESDCDDIPIGEACQHIARWAQVLEKLGASAIHITGVPAPESPDSQRRIPALLMLGATERLGVAALQAPEAAAMHWHWSIEAHAVRLDATGGAPLTLAGSELRDWDAAFMLRHGGMAHAGGAWTFELPLLSGPGSGFEKPHEVFE
jgi:hypothetical protein